MASTKELLAEIQHATSEIMANEWEKGWKVGYRAHITSQLEEVKETARLSRMNADRADFPTLKGWHLGRAELADSKVQALERELESA